MLTADLVRASISKGAVRPRYVSVEDADIRVAAERLIGVFEGHIGQCRGALDEAIADLIGDSPQFMVTRGMARLLSKSTEIETAAAASPEVVRAKVFELSAAGWPVVAKPAEGGPGSRREAVLEAAGTALGITAEQVEAALFADLEREQVLTSMDSWTVDGLLHRYNLALAQGVLLKASEVRISLGAIGAKRARRVFQMLKFHRLMYRAERVKLEPPKPKGKAKAKAKAKAKKGAAPAAKKKAVKASYGYVLTLDGPLSLFQQTTRYGLQLALFLPTLCHCEAWSIQADVTWGKDQRKCTFEVDQDSGLVTHTADKGTWEAEEERQFKAAFKALKTPWKLRKGATIVDLKGRGVFVPDYVLVHPDGRKALLDIVWFWRKQSFAKRLALLSEVGPSNLIVALATKYNADAKGTAGLNAVSAALKGHVYPFKGVIQAKKVVAIAETLGE